MNSVGYCVLAGGLGSRLRPLTDRLPKPLVWFGADGRIIDFTLYNCLASGGGDCLVLTQYLSHLIEGYLQAAWQRAFESQGRKLIVNHPSDVEGFLRPSSRRYSDRWRGGMLARPGEPMWKVEPPLRTRFSALIPGLRMAR